MKYYADKERGPKYIAGKRQATKQNANAIPLVYVFIRLNMHRKCLKERPSTGDHTSSERAQGQEAPEARFPRQVLPLPRNHHRQRNAGSPGGRTCACASATWVRKSGPQGPGLNSCPRCFSPSLPGCSRLSPAADRTVPSLPFTPRLAPRTAHSTLQAFASLLPIRLSWWPCPLWTRGANTLSSQTPDIQQPGHQIRPIRQLVPITHYGSVNSPNFGPPSCLLLLSHFITPSHIFVLALKHQETAANHSQNTGMEEKVLTPSGASDSGAERK